MSTAPSAAAINLKILVQNLGGQAAARIPSGFLQQPDCDIYGFVETMLTDDTCATVSGAIPGCTAWHCVRPRPPRGRPHGGISVYVRRSSPLHLAPGGLAVTTDSHAGIVWLESRHYQLTVAICYFSPQSSAVYGSGVVHPEPLVPLLNGLRAAESKGHKHMVLGDLNIRIGRLSSDVPHQLSVPPFMQACTLYTQLGHLARVPARRHSMDASVPDVGMAEALLEGLASVSSVVLNGRAPGDETGSHTCFSTTDAGDIRGFSVVDLACVSVSLFQLVERFTILPFRPSTSKDHCALYVDLRGVPPKYSCVQPGRRQRVVRPVHAEVYKHAVRQAQRQFEDLLASWREGTMDVTQAMQQFTALLVSCAEGCCAQPTQPMGERPARRDQPWYDGECRSLAQALNVAWDAWHTSRGGLYGSQEGCPHARAALVEARHAYKRTCRDKKRQHDLRQQLDLLKTYFGPEQKDYWKVFFGACKLPIPLTDVSEWTAYFSALLGSPVPPRALSPAEAGLIRELYDVAPRGDQDHMAVLNTDVSFEEAAACMALPGSKAADVFGHTGELLLHAGALERVGDSEQPVCRPAIECMQWLLQSLLDSGRLPESMCISKLVPVPKSSQASALTNMDMYRGIAVSPVLSRAFDRLLNKRLESVTIGADLRAPTQCGFRPGHGTLDALFTIQHLIHAAQHRGDLLVAVFVDFKKAFDTVRRDLLLERCRELGIHGPFMAALVALYDRVAMQVSVGQDLGSVFATTSGTKQGSELSPLLFGLFIELLHELIKLKVPGAGPIIGDMHVPDIMYADDVVLLASGQAAAQQLLDILEVFCTLFGMTVNLAPHKTAAVVFRKPGTPVSRGFRLTYKGREVTRQPSYVYLGVVLHETRGLAGASDALAASGNKAMHAVLSRCRRAHLTQFDIKGRMFDLLVEPVLSYASHVWGPGCFHKLLKQKPFGTKAEQVHSSYLRIMTGSGKGVCLDVLYRDLHRLPVMYHWVKLAVRWWNRLSQAAGQASQPMACAAWRADVALALSGCKRCWAGYLLDTLASMELLEANWRQLGLDDLLSKHWEEASVHDALMHLLHDRWVHLADSDPRSAPSQGVAKCTHAAWVYPLDDVPLSLTRANAPAHTRLCLPFGVLRNLAQLRVGWSGLEVEQGRKRRPQVPRELRVCKLCTGERAPLRWRRLTLLRSGSLRPVEDLKHFVLECPAYDAYRTRCRAFPADTGLRFNDPSCMHDIFQSEHQLALARTLLKMKAHRTELLTVTGD